MFSFTKLLYRTAIIKPRYIHQINNALCAVTVRMPALSPTMTEGNIVEWHKNEGDEVSAGDLLCEIQTDKAVVAMELDEDGVLAKILKPVNAQGVQVGDPIAIVAEAGEDWKTIEVPADALTSSPDVTATSSTPEGVAPGTTTEPVHLEGVGPAVRLLIEQYGISGDKINPSGPHSHNIVKADVLSYIAQNSLKPIVQTAAPPTATAPAPSPAQVMPAVPSTEVQQQQKALFVDIPLTSMRKTIAKRLSESKMTIPHAYTTIRCNIGDLLQRRIELKKEGIKVSVNDYIIKACAMALKSVPEANASYTVDGSVKYNPMVDISVAVSTDAGLITPIVFNADQLGLVAINAEVKSLAEKAKLGKLQPEEFIGGTFTISNLGMFGIKEFTAIINPPQACILAVGTSQFSVSTKPNSATKREARMAITLSADARILDDSTSARFLAQVRANLERPELLEVGMNQGADGLSADPFENALGFD